MSREMISKAATMLAHDYLAMLRDLRKRAPDCTPTRLAPWAEYNGRTNLWMVDAMGGERAFSRWLARVQYTTVERRTSEVVEAARRKLISMARYTDEVLELLTWATREVRL